MSDTLRNPISAALDDLAERGRRISAHERDQRPRDQPSGDRARLAATHWLLSPVVAVEIENAANLFVDGLCAACGRPLGPRNDQTMHVRYSDPIGRSCDGVQARAGDPALGPRAQLYSDRFLDLLSEAERAMVSWRPVEVVNHKKSRRELFELVGARVQVHAVALRGGHTERLECAECRYQSAPRYALVGSLPDWLNPDGDLSYGGQPSTFVSTEQFPEPTPSLFTLEGPREGPRLIVAGTRPWPKPAAAGVQGISRHPLGVVLTALTL